MIKSMTGFGRGTFANAEKQISIEVKTVNHRFLDLSVKLPRPLSWCEDKIRSCVQNRLSRGKADVFVTYTELQKPGCTVHIDKALASAYISAFSEAAEEYQIRNDISANTLLRMPDVLAVTGAEMDEALVWEQLQKALQEALGNLVSMREKEGERLRDNLLEMLCHIGNEMITVAQRAPLVPKEYKEKLEARLEALLQGELPDPQRLAQEVAYFADKCSIDEEITRMGSHIAQFREILSSDLPVGRKLDFLVQEMNREANTMGSKANDIVLTRSVLNIKSEIEKIREQIQNLE